MSAVIAMACCAAGNSCVGANHSAIKRRGAPMSPLHCLGVNRVCSSAVACTVRFLPNACVSDPLPLRGCPPLQGGQFSFSPLRADNLILPLEKGESRRRRQGVAHTETP